jgi:hypothetical protein
MIVIETIPHYLQEYNTCGNWKIHKGSIEITVSDLGNEKHEFLIGLHELIEAYLCKCRGIKEKDVTAFDKEFEAKKVEGNQNEPGDDPKSPYKKEHFFATSIERLMAAELGVDWNEYDKHIGEL